MAELRKKAPNELIEIVITERRRADDAESELAATREAVKAGIGRLEDRIAAAVSSCTISSRCVLTCTQEENSAKHRREAEVLSEQRHLLERILNASWIRDA